MKTQPLWHRSLIYEIEYIMAGLDAINKTFLPRLNRAWYTWTVIVSHVIWSSQKSLYFLLRGFMIFVRHRIMYSTIPLFLVLPFSVQFRARCNILCIKERLIIFTKLYHKTQSFYQLMKTYHNSKYNKTRYQWTTGRSLWRLIYADYYAKHSYSLMRSVFSFL